MTGPIIATALRLARDNQQLRRDLARVEKAARNLLETVEDANRSLYLAHERIEWLQGQIENQDDVRTLLGWMEETG